MTSFQKVSIVLLVGGILGVAPLLSVLMPAFTLSWEVGASVTGIGVVGMFFSLQ